VLPRQGISLANQGAGFGVIGNEPALSTGKGRAYGLELLAQQRLFKGFFGIVAYTLVRSEFTTPSGKYLPSSWDNKHILSLTAGKIFAKRNIEVGAKFRLLGGGPYTPYDIARSSNIQSFNTIGTGILDTARYNSLRGNTFTQLDIRVDKKWNFNKRYSLDFYIDIQNVLNQATTISMEYDVQRTSKGDPIVDPNDPSRYLSRSVKNQSGTLIPSFGVILDF